MIQFAEKCIEEALKKGVRAQVVTSSSIESSSNYKPLTGDSVHNESSSEHIVLTLERNGQKATLSRAYTSSLDAGSLVQEALQLLEYPTADSAEKLPVISDVFSGDARLFTRTEGYVWQKSAYEHILSFMK